ncbi:hypothetical protein BDV29DRAFT_184372 [Aspergillus leporis]|uniref:Uncharacterized protein n=1 Tax=Aspergillus leporis TaxID=41062 RepID=A0A5N5WMY2_9EURO|nr:hypothetical protein BDV29DRAFT_184372 [Aspergillus leporis]
MLSSSGRKKSPMYYKTLAIEEAQVAEAAALLVRSPRCHLHGCARRQTSLERWHDSLLPRHFQPKFHLPGYAVLGAIASALWSARSCTRTISSTRSCYHRRPHNARRSHCTGLGQGTRLHCRVKPRSAELRAGRLITSR